MASFCFSQKHISYVIEFLTRCSSVGLATDFISKDTKSGQSKRDQIKHQIF